MGAMHAPTDRRSVVYLDPAPRAAFDTREEPRPRMDQRNETFVPHVLADRRRHDGRTFRTAITRTTTCSRSRRRKSFDLGRYAVGRSKSVRFDRPGIVRVFCDIHSHMSAFILVFAHRYFAVTDADGRYRLDNVPPGTYTVDGVERSRRRSNPRRVVVPEAGGEVEVNFALGRR